MPIARLLLSLFIVVALADREALADGYPIVYTNPIHPGARIEIDQDGRTINVLDLSYSYSLCGQFKHCMISRKITFAYPGKCEPGTEWLLNGVKFRAVEQISVSFLGVAIDDFCEVAASRDGKAEWSFGVSDRYGLLAIGVEGTGSVMANSLPMGWTVPRDELR